MSRRTMPRPKKRKAELGADDPAEYIRTYCIRRGLSCEYGASPVERECQALAQQAREEFKHHRDGGVDRDALDRKGLSPAEKYTIRLQNNRKSADASKVFNEVLKREQSHRLASLSDPSLLLSDVKPVAFQSQSRTLAAMQRELDHFKRENNRLSSALQLERIHSEKLTKQVQQLQQSHHLQQPQQIQQPHQIQHHHNPQQQQPQQSHFPMRPAPPPLHPLIPHPLPQSQSQSQSQSQPSSQPNDQPSSQQPQQTHTPHQSHQHQPLPLQHHGQHQPQQQPHHQLTHLQQQTQSQQHQQRHHQHHQQQHHQQSLHQRLVSSRALSQPFSLSPPDPDTKEFHTGLTYTQSQNDEPEVKTLVRPSLPLSAGLQIGLLGSQPSQDLPGFKSSMGSDEMPIPPESEFFLGSQGTNTTAKGRVG